MGDCVPRCKRFGLSVRVATLRPGRLATCEVCGRVERSLASRSLAIPLAHRVISAEPKPPIESSPPLGEPTGAVSQTWPAIEPVGAPTGLPLSVGESPAGALSETWVTAALRELHAYIAMIVTATDHYPEAKRLYHMLSVYGVPDLPALPMFALPPAITDFDQRST